MFSMVPVAEQGLNYKYLLNEKTRSKRIISRMGDIVKEEKTSWNMGKTLEYLTAYFLHPNSIKVNLCTYPRNAVVTLGFGFPHEG